MQNLRSWAAICALPMALSGCANFSELKIETNPQVEDVANNVECDITEALYLLTDAPEIAGQPGYFEKPTDPDGVLADRRKWLDKLSAKIDIQLVMDASDTGSADLAVVPPWSPGRWSIGASSSLTRSTKSARQLQYYLSFNGVRKPRDRRTPDFCKTTQGIKRNWRLSGTLGTGAWLINSTRSFEVLSDKRSSTRGPSYPASITFQTEFVIRSDGGIGPTFELVPVGTSILGGSFGYKGGRGQTNKLTVTIEPAALNFPEAVIAPNRSRDGSRPQTRPERGASPRTTSRTSAEPNALPQPQNDPRVQRQLDRSQSNFILNNLDPELLQNLD